LKHYLIVHKTEHQNNCN